MRAVKPLPAPLNAPIVVPAAKISSRAVVVVTGPLLAKLLVPDAEACPESEVQRTPNRLDDSELSRFWGGLAMGRRFAPLELNEAELTELRSLASRRSTAQGLALRARIILVCADGEQSKVVAARLGIDQDTVGKWRRRFAEYRLEGLWDYGRIALLIPRIHTRSPRVSVGTLWIEQLPEPATGGSDDGWKGLPQVRLRCRCCVTTLAT